MTTAKPYFKYVMWIILFNTKKKKNTQNSEVSAIIIPSWLTDIYLSA